MTKKQKKDPGLLKATILLAKKTRNLNVSEMCDELEISRMFYYRLKSGGRSSAADDPVNKVQRVHDYLKKRGGK